MPQARTKLHWGKSTLQRGIVDLHQVRVDLQRARGDLERACVDPGKGTATTSEPAKESLRNNMVAAVSLGERLCSSIPRESYPGGDRFPTSFSLTFFPAGLRYDVKRRGL
jgi:hypothetical protein